MKRKNKLPQNFDTKVLTINHIGSKGEGVSYLYTEFDYKENAEFFFTGEMLYPWMLDDYYRKI